ncbi:MAG: hypothetical protein PHN18_05850 [Sulfurospirillaceae bacterium]|nr:hypothetical protein [Sulfurospirillaceae bacterium]MDD2825835.1 hypothetical protein [Sulfurospirillaceae bacterium]
MDKGEKFTIVGYASAATEAKIGTDDNASNDILLIKGEASNATSGLSIPTDATNNDIAGKPDRNDFWVFNPNSSDINVTSSTVTSGTVASVIVAAQSVKLLDVNGTDPVAVTAIKVNLSNGTGTAGSFSAPN